MENALIATTSQMLSQVKPATAELISIVGTGNEIDLALYEKELTMDKAIDGTSLRKLSKTINDKNLTKIIVFMINRLTSNFNVGKNIKPDQAIRIAVDLIDSFEYETLEDLLLMFKMARTGRIGNGKDFKLDSQTVFNKWLPEYLELKAEARERSHRREQDKHTALPKWDLKDIEKFKTSDKRETLETEKNTLGDRTKKEFGTPGRTTPIVDRRTYLKALAYEATKHSVKNLKNALSFFKEKNEQDAIGIIEEELKNR